MASPCGCAVLAALNSGIHVVRFVAPGHSSFRARSAGTARAFPEHPPSPPPPLNPIPIRDFLLPRFSAIYLYSALLALFRIKG